MVLQAPTPTRTSELKMTRKNIHSRAYHRALSDAKNAGIEVAQAKLHAQAMAAQVHR
jgi:hypothetical protein